MNDHPESFPPAGDEPEPVPFEDIVKGLEGLGADVEREEKAAQEQTSRERAERGGEPSGPGGQEAGGDAANPLAGLLGALGLGGRGGGDMGESLAGLAAGLGQQMPGLDPQMFMMMMGRIQSLINAGDGPVNWALARDVARTVTAAQPDPSPTSGDLAPIEDAVRLAEHWLDEVTALPAGTTGAMAWSRAEWIEQTLPGLEAARRAVGGPDGPVRWSDCCPRRRRWPGCRSPGSCGRWAARCSATRRDGVGAVGDRSARLVRHRAAARPGRQGRCCCRRTSRRSAQGSNCRAADVRLVPGDA